MLPLGLVVVASTQAVRIALDKTMPDLRYKTFFAIEMGPKGKDSLHPQHMCSGCILEKAEVNGRP